MINATEKSGLPVSPNNPCPFLRALVASGELADGAEPLAHIAEVVARVARSGEGQPSLPAAAIYAIAMGANGLSPLALLTARRVGVRLNRLRAGPLDKKGVGSGILNARGQVDRKQLARLGEFARDMTRPDGTTEPGLGQKELRAFMAANFKRAAGQRRRIDRALMNGEWPVLLKVMGKPSAQGRYLSVKEVGDLFKNRRLPQRMNSQLSA